MANSEPLTSLRPGVDIWNEWRAKASSVLPDSSRRNLCVADLRGANLTGANLTKAELNEADLDGAFLNGANLSG
jgi:uncharacterized protein YjbI with pentapeptide repeats